MQEWTELLGVLVWPVVVVVGVVLFRAVIRDLLTRDEVSIDTPVGLTISAKRAAGALVNASNKSGADMSESAATERVQAIAEFVERLGREPRVLWVDDHPSNNRYETAAFEGMGLVVELCTTTRVAMERLRRRGLFDVVISDMKREEGVQAGYDLLRRMRRRHDWTPFVIYASSDDRKDFDEAIERGATGSTNHPAELVDMVLRALRAGPPRPRWWSPRRLFGGR